MPPFDQLRKSCESPLVQPDDDSVRAAAHAIQELLLRDFATLPERSLGQTTHRSEMERRLREPPPEAGLPLADVLATVQRDIMPFALRPQHPRFAAFVPSAPTLVSVLGDWLCAGLNHFAGVWKEAPAAAQVEILVLDWFAEFLGLPASTRGVLTGGGSEANLTALVTAREQLVEGDRPRAIVYFSEHRHWSIDRAAKVMGMRPEQLRPLAVDRLFRLEATSLEKAVAQDRLAGRLPWLVVANAGATNTGSVDPLDSIADVCGREGLWLHVDGAYGWPAVLTEEGRAQLRGIERADSVTLDPHKWFAQTFEAGCVLVRDGKRLTEAFMLRPDYMQDVTPGEEEINFADHGIALTRRFRALKIWFSIKALGVGWFRRLVDHCCGLAEFAQAALQRAGCFEILCPRQLSIVCFRYLPGQHRTDAALDDFNSRLCEAILQSGQAFLSTTRLDGRVALRLCFVNYRTTAADVEMIVELLCSLAETLRAP